MDLIDREKYRKDLLSAYDDVSMEFNVLDSQQMVKAIQLDKVKQAREEIENKIHKDPYLNFSNRNRERNDAFIEVLEILDKLIESEDKE